MSTANPTSSLLRRLTVGIVTQLIATPISFVLFSMGLVVHEAVMFPLATLVIAVITALIASWITWKLAGNGHRADLSQVIPRNLAWGVIPAVAAAIYPLAPLFPNAVLQGAALVYTTAMATRLSFRYRTPETSLARGLGLSAVWVVGTGLAMAAVIFVASLFDLTGA